MKRNGLPTAESQLEFLSHGTIGIQAEQQFFEICCTRIQLDRLAGLKDAMAEIEGNNLEFIDPRRKS